MSDDGPTITFDPEVIGTILDAFGWSTDEFGFVVDEDDELVTDTRGVPIHDWQVGGIVNDENDDPVPLRDNFCDICDYVMDRDSTRMFPESAGDVRDVKDNGRYK